MVKEEFDKTTRWTLNDLIDHYGNKRFLDDDDKELFKNMVENNENPFMMASPLKILANNVIDRGFNTLVISHDLVDHDLFTKMYNKIKINKCNCEF